MILTPLPVPVEITEEGYDYPPIVDYPMGLAGRKNHTPQASTAELFREFQHFGLRSTWTQEPAVKKGPSILLPKTCEVVRQDMILVDRPLADCGLSKVLAVKVRLDATSSRAHGQEVGKLLPCVARLVREPNRQFWREVGVWSSLRHEHIVRFVGVCISAQGPLSICMHYPEGSVYEDNARLRATAPSSSALSWGLRCGWTLVNWVKQLVSAMHYLHGLTPWPVLYRNLKSSNLMLSERHTKISLTDFAICRPIAQHDDITPAQGSDRWLAPEALMGKQNDLAGDVFSFALTCWELTACEIPFALHSSRQAATLIVEGLRPTVPSHCPDWLAKLMATCNAHMPEARPTFAAVHAALFASTATDAGGLSASIDALLASSERTMLANLEKAAHRPPAALPSTVATPTGVAVHARGGADAHARRTAAQPLSSVRSTLQGQPILEQAHQQHPHALSPQSMTPQAIMTPHSTPIHPGTPQLMTTAMNPGFAANVAAALANNLIPHQQGGGSMAGSSHVSSKLSSRAPSSTGS